MMSLRKVFGFFFTIWAPIVVAQVLDISYEGEYNTAHLTLVPAPPNYTNLKHWIAHPDKEDFADKVPGKGTLSDRQSSAEVDVFFVYPTIYTGKQNEDFPWFADVNDDKLNKDIATSTIKYQASVFNGAGRIYAPLYRQAHIGVFFSDSVLMRQALDVAYQDVKAAFEYYLNHWNNDRPFIIASHSQGTVHAARLMREYLDGQPLREKLVAAYIVGMPVKHDYFAEIPVCETPDQTGCWVTWNTFLHGYEPPYAEIFSEAASVNPLTWTTDSTRADWSQNEGGILKNFRKIRPGLSDAQNHEGLLWIQKPRFFGNFLLRWKRFHVVDFNLFYMNIRKNAQRRVDAYRAK